MASIEEDVQTVQFFPESNSADSVHASRRRIKNHCCDVFQRGRLAGHLPEGAGATNSVLQQILVGEEEHGIVGFCGKEFRQDEDFGIRVTAKDNIEQVQQSHMTQNMV